MNISLYFHIPFCRRRCGYCDFNTFAGLNSFIPEYVNALCQEIEAVSNSAPNPLQAHTLFFGGGTPSLLSIDQYSQILKQVKQNFVVTDDAEITLEANPGTVSKGYLDDLKHLGFNRISFGMQSASPEDLRVLDREHEYKDVINAVLWSKQAGFEHINLDLIFGIPGQTRKSWQRTLELAMMFRVDHYSIYSLIVEDGTPMKKWVDRGLLVNPSDDLAASMYEDAMDFMSKAGFSQYEISNWSRDAGARCRHNLQYWRFLPYLGFGAGAHGFMDKKRTENAGLVYDYIRRIKLGKSMPFPIGPAALPENRLTTWDLIQENLMVSLRLTEEGILLPDFKARYGIDLLEVFDAQIERLTGVGLIESYSEGRGYRLTRKGCLFGNRVFSEFIGNDLPVGYEYLGV